MPVFAPFVFYRLHYRLKNTHRKVKLMIKFDNGTTSLDLPVVFCWIGLQQQNPAILPSCQTRVLQTYDSNATHRQVETLGTMPNIPP